MSLTSIGRRVREKLARPEPDASGGECEHLKEALVDPAPLSERCGACLAQGTDWNDLRLCLACGEVGCCDSSPWQHAHAHAQATGHPVMRSFHNGESWRWCYVDEMLG